MSATDTFLQLRLAEFEARARASERLRIVRLIASLPVANTDEIEYRAQLLAAIATPEEVPSGAGLCPPERSNLGTSSAAATRSTAVATRGIGQA